MSPNPVYVHFYSLNDEDFDTSQEVVLGPFEYIQMTYSDLRDDTGRTVAYAKDDGWRVGNEHYSDFEVTADKP